MEWHFEGRALPSVLWPGLSSACEKGAVAHFAFLYEGTFTSFEADFGTDGPSYNVQNLDKPSQPLRGALYPRPHLRGEAAPFPPGAFEEPLHTWPLTEQPSPNSREHPSPSTGRTIDFMVSLAVRFVESTGTVARRPTRQPVLAVGGRRT